MLHVQQVSKRFGNKIVLKEASFSLEKGTIGLLGPNGAGKTTLLRILATYYQPSVGKVTLDNLNWNSDIEEVRKLIGYLPQQIGVFPLLTVEEYLNYIGLLRGMNSTELSSKILEVLREVNLEDRIRDKVKSLSGGMKQRLGIAQAIMDDPKLLLVDEPTAGLDPEERIRFRNLIKRLSQNRIVIFSTHITEDIVMTCDQILLMNKGTVMKYDHFKKIIDMADGKVWSLTTDATTYNHLNIKTDVFISNVQEQINQLVNLRIVSNEKPHPKAQSAKPTLEEGYMLWLQKN